MKNETHQNKDASQAGWIQTEIGTMHPDTFNLIYEGESKQMAFINFIDIPDIKPTKREPEIHCFGCDRHFPKGLVRRENGKDHCPFCYGDNLKG